MSRLITRRDFSKAAMFLAAGAVSPLAWNMSAAETAPAENSTPPKQKPRYRAVSWWLTWDDLTWPNPELMDKIRRRADKCAENGVNCALIFGAHFRWDFMPIWGRLHDELRFIADELHQRKILLFDHHSSVLTHRPRNREETLNIWQRNRHHVPFYPSLAEAATWQYHGSRLNDWRMLDVETSEPIYLPAYNAEQYCMNNPAFRAAYAEYIKRLHADTGMDGLMSDDNIFYADWRSCSCEHCRARFKKDYDHTLPPVSDASFWGNRRSEAFKDWIAMRFKSSGDFLADTKSVLPEDFPLLTCCSSSDSHYLPAFGMSYEDFIEHCNHVLLEMVGSTPSLAGTWDDRIPSQLLHLGIARDHNAPCFGLGYGFFSDTAFFVWAVNKFLGSDSWFSTLKGRLNASPAELAPLADDADLVGEGYRWERDHPELFVGEVDTDIAVLFSRSTRDNYGQVAGDYSGDYAASCLSLTRAGITCDVVTAVPEFGRLRCLVVSSASCLSDGEKRRLAKFVEAGGKVIATGPTGFYDERANAIAKSWLAELGIATELSEPKRPGGFPPYQNLKSPVELAQCRVGDAVHTKMKDGWLRVVVGKGELLWQPERISQRAVADAVIKLVSAQSSRKAQVDGLPAGWQLRQFSAGDRILIHALPAKVETILHPTLTNQMSGQRIVERLKFTRLESQLTIYSATVLKQIRMHSPDLNAVKVARSKSGGKWSVDPGGVSRYFILECQA
jgi:hypothetical protein